MGCTVTPLPLPRCMPTWNRKGRINGMSGSAAGRPIRSSLSSGAILNTGEQEVAEHKQENSTSNTETPNKPHPLQDSLQDGDLDQKLQGRGDKFNVELSNLSLVRGKGNGVMLRFNLSWFLRDEIHGWLGDTSIGCLAFRDRMGVVHWGNHKLSFGGPFSKAVHSPTKGYYNLVLGIITGSKFEKKLVSSEQWGKAERKRQAAELNVPLSEKLDGVLKDEEGQEEVEGGAADITT